MALVVPLGMFAAGCGDDGFNETPAADAAEPETDAGSPETDAAEPEPDAGQAVTGALARVGAGNHHSVIMVEDVVYAMGENASGQLGNGVFDPSPSSSLNPTPGPVMGLDGLTVRSVYAGLNHNAALTEDGQLYVWGANNTGQLGDGAEENRNQAAMIALENVASVAFGTSHSLAVTTAGELYAWGNNSFGKLGLGDTEERLVPTRVEALAEETIVAAVASVLHSVAITDDGRVFTWGRDSRGQIGDGDDSNDDEVLTPFEVPGVSGVVSIGAGNFNTFAVTGDGELYGWGEGRYGQLMDVDPPTNSDGDEYTPRLLDLRDVAAVAGGSRYVVALTTFGEVYSWGDNGPIGALGRGIQTDDVFSTPAPIASPPGVRFSEVVCATNHCLALAEDGTVFSWGTASYGRLGVDLDFCTGLTKGGPDQPLGYC
ncbi:MAG: hypothetical protein AAGC55_25135, partial [Myxococcota bacterium]